MFGRTLFSYLFRQNMFYILTCLAVGSGLYLMTDIFDRLDDFLSAGLGASTVATYFVVKLPLIISQILPAVFLLSVVIQLCLMARHRELLALRSGGISFGHLARFFVLYGVLWAVIQLMFSQGLGVYGQQLSSKIWAEQVRGKIVETRELTNLWFKEGNFVVEVKSAQPAKKTAQNVKVYELSADRRSLMKIYTAKRAHTEPGDWQLIDVKVLNPGAYTSEQHKILMMPFEQNMETFLAADSDSNPGQLPLWKLSQLIEQLDAAGSNVERLRTEWHGKWGYAFAIVTMSILALAMLTFSENMYLNIGLSLIVTFAYYVVFMIGTTLGQKGLVNPILGAWLANIVFSMLGTLRLVWVALSAQHEA
ncbi:LptF/LptG family permease [Desulfobaculum bizertense]|uniref:Lipopolysaccharide export system permease protein n=1 Tax=Desulfobaculum bizertense DSM 18034 TaxID=1121442 RepID=A0A1T4W1Y6_9BACT|nr:LptF/LptG family permease [Desulfobaculum bizertense]SKA71266.1 lipopolysaccharide export system permease protein [Desulfobaculum bizertense DSM 18034]